MGLALEKGQGRLGVIYIPNGISCRWEEGAPAEREATNFGACIYLYVDKAWKQTKAAASATEKTPAAAPAETPTPAPVPAPAPEKPAEFGGVEK